MNKKNKDLKKIKNEDYIFLTFNYLPSDKVMGKMIWDTAKLTGDQFKKINF